MSDEKTQPLEKQKGTLNAVEKFFIDKNPQMNVRDLSLALKVKAESIKAYRDKAVRIHIAEVKPLMTKKNGATVMTESVSELIDSTNNRPKVDTRCVFQPFNKEPDL